MKTLAIFFLVVLCAAGHTNDRANDRAKVRIYVEDVEELVFPPMKIDLNDLYVKRLMLRFSEPWMQIVIIERTDGAVEVRQYTIDSKAGVDEMFRRANQGDTRITAAEIARKTHVSQKRIPVSSEQVHAWFAELKAMKLSPVLEDVICLHGCPQFQLSFDTRQDLVRYSVLYAPAIPPIHSTSELIAKWMLKVRAEATAASKP